MDELIERLKVSHSVQVEQNPLVEVGGSIVLDAANRLEKVRDFFKMLEDPATAPAPEWCAARARELLA